jgi:hypothetical protein
MIWGCATNLAGKIRNKVIQAIFNIKVTHSMRYLFQPEIAMLGKISNFNVEHGEEWMTGNVLGTSTWGACCTLKAE